MSRGSHFSKILAIDCETSGMAFGDDPSDGYQMVSIGLIVSDVTTYAEIDSLYLEIKWNGESQWNVKAEEIHGLSKEYLEENGIDEEEATILIVEFIMKHFDINSAITLLGHNVVSFDKPFFKALLRKFDIKLKISHRALDSFPVGLLAVGAFDSDELFEKIGFPPRKEHNALEDIRYTLKSYRILNKIFRNCIDG
ncbi:DNA polymerase III epsilon subunit [Xanthomonas phage Xoo-sp13]|nr:DNA polymerase III epsilon subunit [Xanthomonas phage Xoo-sp13]